MAVEELWKSDDTTDALLLPLFPLWDGDENENDDARGKTSNAKQIVARTKTVTRILKDANVDLDADADADAAESERDDADDVNTMLVNATNTAAVPAACYRFP